MQRPSYQPSMTYLNPKFRDHSDDQGQHSEESELSNARQMRNAIEGDLFVNGLIMHLHAGNMSEEEQSMFRGVEWDQQQHYRRLLAMTGENVHPS